MKAVILDGHSVNPGDLSWDVLKKYCELTVYEDVTDSVEETVRRIGDAEIVIVGSTKITKEVINSCPNIRFISVLATGYNIIDCDYAAEKGIPVSNVPSYGTASVGQFAIALLLELCCNVRLHSDRVHSGQWEETKEDCFSKYPIIELAGKTMGIIGFGRIGQTTGRIAKAMGMKVLAAGSRPTAAGEAIAEYVDMDTLLARSDVISLHCPLFPETKEIINRNTISKMKDGVILINSSRGGLVDEQALADALNCGKVFGAAVDVVSVEPILPDNPLLTARNCLITPHVAWLPIEARQRIIDCCDDNLRGFVNGHPVNVVNRK